MGSLFILLQVAKHRRDFELASANNEYDNAIQTANNDAEENIRNTYERLRERIQESICALQVEHAMAKRSRRSFASASAGEHFAHFIIKSQVSRFQF